MSQISTYFSFILKPNNTSIEKITANHKYSFFFKFSDYKFKKKIQINGILDAQAVQEAIKDNLVTVRNAATNKPILQVHFSNFSAILPVYSIFKTIISHLYKAKLVNDRFLSGLLNVTNFYFFL